MTKPLVFDNLLNEFELVQQIELYNACINKKLDKHYRKWGIHTNQVDLYDTTNIENDYLDSVTVECYVA